MLLHCLHLPVDFEMREDVRKLVHVLNGAGLAEQAKRAALFFVRIWTDWARAGVEWRPLEGSWPTEHEIDWARESITHIIESYCGWDGHAGTLMQVCLTARVFELKREGELLGLVLRDFWRYNEHLSPGYLSIQQRGGKGKAAAAAERQLQEAAGQQRRMLQPDLISAAVTTAKPTEEEENRAVALVMRMDRACGMAMRVTSQYSAEMLACAVEVVRKHKPDAITVVERYLHRNRDNPEVVKVTERIVSHFDDYFRAAV